jgi:hypothetical protein
MHPFPGCTCPGQTTWRRRGCKNHTGSPGSTRANLCARSCSPKRPLVRRTTHASRRRRLGSPRRGDRPEARSPGDTSRRGLSAFACRPGHGEPMLDVLLNELASVSWAAQPGHRPKNVDLHPFSTGGLGMEGKAHPGPGVLMGCSSRRHGKVSHRAGRTDPGVPSYGVGSVSSCSPSTRLTARRPRGTATR